MTYEYFLGMERSQILEKVSDKMSSERFKHVLGVEDSAIKLAKIFGEDKEKAGLAGLLHDYAKELPDSAFLSLIDCYHLNPELKIWGNNIWHGLVGIYKIQEDFGLADAEILRAIEIHTVGASDMSLLDKIVYVADYIEPSRSFPGVDVARDLAMESLDVVVAYETASTIKHLVRQHLPIYPQTLDTYNTYCRHLKING